MFSVFPRTSAVVNATIMSSSRCVVQRVVKIQMHERFTLIFIYMCSYIQSRDCYYRTSRSAERVYYDRGMYSSQYTHTHPLCRSICGLSIHNINRGGGALLFLPSVFLSKTQRRRRNTSCSARVSDKNSSVRNFIAFLYIILYNDIKH